MNIVVREEIRNSCHTCCTKLQDVTVKFGKEMILEKVNLHIHCGKLTAVVGPNGAGKTTMLKAILEEIPFSGSLSTDLRHTETHRDLRIGYVPQKLNFDPSAPVTVLDLFAASLSRRPLWLGRSGAVKSTAESALTLTRAESLIHKRVGTLSGGELQRVLLALALTPTPDLLLLDEPVSGVDPAGVELFYSMVSKLRKDHHMAVLMVTHDCGVAAEFADEMIFLNRKVICQDKPEIVLRHPEFVRIFGEISIPHREVTNG